MSLTNYYVAFIAPLMITILFAVYDFTCSFAVSLLIYYIYRIFLDYYKLKKAKVVTKKDIWKFIVPLWSFLYFKELYFK